MTTVKLDHPNPYRCAESGCNRGSVCRSCVPVVAILRSMLIVAGIVNSVCAGDDKPTVVTVVNVDGKQWKGELRSIDVKSIAVREGKGERRFPLSDLLRVDFPKRDRLSSRERAILYLANGDRIFARPLRTTDGDVVCEWTLLKEAKTNVANVPAKLRIPLTKVRGILLAVPQSPRQRILRERVILRHREQTDILLLNNGDQISTIFQSLDSTTVKTRRGGKTKRKAVIAIAFNPKYIQFPQRKGVRVLLELADGSRLTAVRISFAGGKNIRLHAALGRTLELPLTAVRSLRILGGRAVSLSDRKPAGYQFTPYLDGRWNYTRDRAVTGGRLLLRGREYAKGLGMHSAGRLTFDVTHDDRQFLTMVGIDDAAGGRGSVIVAVELDGKRVFTSKLLTGRDPPLRVGPLSLTGKKRITLIVEFGERADVLDLVNWCDAVFVRRPSS